MHILFITSTRIGDAVISTGVLKALVDEHPGARFTIVCGPLATSLFAAVPRVERIIPLRKRPLDLHWYTLWPRLCGTSWDIVVDLRRSLIAYTLRAKQRLISPPQDRRVPRVQSLPAVIGRSGALDPYVYIDERHQRRAETVIPDGAPVLALGPVASLPEKTWPQQRFSELVRLLCGSGGLCEGWRVAAFGGPGDEAAVSQVLAGVPAERRIALVAEPDLLTVQASLARCALFVGNDSGLSHMAAAAGIPTLAVFGATDADRYAPWGGAVVRAPGGDLKALAPGAVVDAATQLMKGGGRARRQEQKG